MAHIINIIHHIIDNYVVKFLNIVVVAAIHLVVIIYNKPIAKHLADALWWLNGAAYVAHVDIALLYSSGALHLYYPLMPAAYIVQVARSHRLVFSD